MQKYIIVVVLTVFLLLVAYAVFTYCPSAGNCNDWFSGGFSSGGGGGGSCGTGTITACSDLNMNCHSICRVKTVNGVVVEKHGFRHLPYGDDPLDTAPAVTLSKSSTNTEGSSNAFARSDHTHELDLTGFPGGGDVSSNVLLSKVNQLSVFADLSGKLITTFSDSGILKSTGGVVSAGPVDLSSPAEATGILQDASFPALSGDLTNAAGSTVVSLVALVPPVAGIYSNPTITVDTKGRVTAAVSGVMPSFKSGNVAYVDQVNGDDGTGLVNGPPFKTIQKAIDACAAGQTTFVYPGIYNESLVIKDGVAVIGMDTATCQVRQVGVGADTTLVTMGETTQLSNFTLLVTSLINVTLTGVLFGGTTTKNSFLSNCNLTVNNTGAGAKTTTGIKSTGTGAPFSANYALQNVEVVVTGSGGAARGLELSTAAHSFNANSSRFFVTGGSSSTGAETSFAGTKLGLQNCVLDGGTQDILQTTGTITVSGGTKLQNSTAGGLGFSVANGGFGMSFGESSNLANLATKRYYYVGTANTSTTPIEIFTRVPYKCICRGMLIQASQTAAGGRSMDTWVVRKNAGNTTITTTMKNPDVQATIETASATFATTDTLGIEVTPGTGGSGPRDVQITLLFY